MRAATDRSLRGRVVVAGIGETQYYRHGGSPDPEFKLALKAILAACEDAGLDPREIDGFASYSEDRSEASRLAAALGIHQLRTATMQWGGGGGGCCAAVANAAASIVAGIADCVVVFRSLAQGEYGRFGQTTGISTISGEKAYLMPYGVLAPPQRFAMRVRRFMHEHGVKQEAFRAIALASYHHAQNNPRAVMYGKPLDPAKYDAITLDRRALSLIRLLHGKRWRRSAHPCWPQSALKNFRTSRFTCLAPPSALVIEQEPFLTILRDTRAQASIPWRRISTAWRTSAPNDVGVVQSYENFTGGVAMALAEHGFFAPEQANEFLTFENLTAPSGRLPLNTSGGNLAECYMHGLELVLEAVRQVRGTSTNQVPRNDVALVIGGPMVTPTSDLLLGSEAALQ